MGIVSHTVDCSSLSIEKDHLNNVEYKFSGVIVSFFKWLYIGCKRMAGFGTRLWEPFIRNEQLLETG